MQPPPLSIKARFEASDVGTLKFKVSTILDFSQSVKLYKVAYKSSSMEGKTVNFRNHKFPFIDK